MLTHLSSVLMITCSKISQVFYREVVSKTGMGAIKDWSLGAQNSPDIGQH